MNSQAKGRCQWSNKRHTQIGQSIRHSPFAIRHSPFAIRHSPLANVAHYPTSPRSELSSQVIQPKRIGSMTLTAKSLLLICVIAVAGCGPGRGKGGLPPGQVKHATGINPASGHVQTPGPVKVKIK